MSEYDFSKIKQFHDFVDFVTRNENRKRDVKVSMEIGWTFPDGHYDSVSFSNRILLLKVRQNDKYVPVGVMKYIVDYIDGVYSIRIHYIQGVKGQGAIKEGFAKDWYDYLIRDLLLAYIPFSRDLDFKFILEAGKKTELEVKKIAEDIEYFKERLKFYKENGILSSVVYVEKEIEDLKERLERKRNALILYKKIRDRWFRKNWALNKEKSRVKEVFKKAKKYILYRYMFLHSKVEHPKFFPKILKPKRKIKLK